jgi:predicted TIM-barrel fold metal-dependent hydrolase
MTAHLDYGLFDVDNHFYETEDAWTRYLDKEYRELLGEFHLTGGGGGGRQKPPPGQEGWVVRPGSLKELLRKMKSDVPDDYYPLMAPLPAFSNREARIKLMDEQGIDACLMFSSAVSTEMLYFRDKDPRALHAHFHALNRWVEDEWGYTYQGRVFCPAMMTLRDLDLAVEELERVISQGAKVINLRPGHAYGRSPGDPYFDPFWARVNEAKLAVAFHQGESGWNAAVAPDWGYEANPPVLEQSAWQWLNSYGNTAIIAALSALLYDNLFGRFPNIKVASVENGAGWLPYFMSHIDKMRGMGRNGPWNGGQLSERPTAIARRHILVAPYPEDDVEDLVRQVGHEMIAMGSDYPHAEGMAEPRDFQKLVDALPQDQQRWILRDNGMRLVTQG